jgi:hypothetical protein
VEQPRLEGADAAAQSDVIIPTAARAFVPRHEQRTVCITVIGISCDIQGASCCPPPLPFFCIPHHRRAKQSKTRFVSGPCEESRTEGQLFSS